MSENTKILVETKTTVINNCTECPFHEVQPDPDPNDWFCDDDVKVYCHKSKKNVTCACRPYNIKKESEVPEWCELQNKQ